MAHAPHTNEPPSYPALPGRTPRDGPVQGLRRSGRTVRDNSPPRRRRPDQRPLDDQQTHRAQRSRYPHDSCAPRPGPARPAPRKSRRRSCHVPDQIGIGRRTPHAQHGTVDTEMRAARTPLPVGDRGSIQIDTGAEPAKHRTPAERTHRRPKLQAQNATAKQKRTCRPPRDSQPSRGKPGAPGPQPPWSPPARPDRRRHPRQTQLAERHARS